MSTDETDSVNGMESEQNPPPEDEPKPELELQPETEPESESQPQPHSQTESNSEPPDSEPIPSESESKQSEPEPVKLANGADPKPNGSNETPIRSEDEVQQSPSSTQEVAQPDLLQHKGSPTFTMKELLNGLNHDQSTEDTSSPYRFAS